MATRSAKLRAEGNKLYLSLTPHLAPCFVQTRLEKAAALYEEAATEATNEEERASAWKNLASCHAKRVEKGLYTLEEVLEACTALCRASGLALASGQECKPAIWSQNILCSLHASLATARDALSDQDVNCDLAWLAKLLGSLENDPVGIKANVGIICARHILHLSINFIEGYDFKTGLKCVYEASSPLESAAQAAGGSIEILEQYDEIKQDLFKNQCICESVLARGRAAAMLESSLADSENLDMDLMWLIADAFKDAAVITREMDIECEAIALACLGKLYFQIMKLEDRATTCLKQSLLLAQSLYPVPTQDEWYRDVVSILAKIQMAIAQRFDAAWQKKREPILKMLQKEIAELNTAFKHSADRLLNHIYEKHPPLNPAHQKPEWVPDTLKKALRTAITHYHPDRTQQQLLSDERFVLCEEITKLLNQKYSLFK